MTSYDQSPFFSIIIPIYNKELYIENCINSIITQTFASFEVIIINDGSTDGSQTILNNIIDERFKVITIKNGGVSNARNIGLSFAIGEYILFIDADDYISSTYFQTIFEALKKYNDIDLLIFGLSKVYCADHIKTLNPSKCGIIAHQDFIETYMAEFENLDGIYGFVCNKAVKRSLITQHNLKFCTNIKQAEDLDFWIDVYKLKPSMAFLQYSGYYYIQSAENSSAFYDCDPWPQIGIWLKTYHLLSPCNSTNLLRLKERLWSWFEVIFWECTDISFKTITNELNRINNIRQEYDFLNHYQPVSFLRKQIMQCNKLNIYLYLKARQTYHLLRKWLK